MNNAKQTGENTMTTQTARRYLCADEINEIVADVLAAHEVHPLTRSRMKEVAEDSCIERFGFYPAASLSLLVVKRTLMGWEGIKRATKRQIK